MSKTLGQIAFEAYSDARSGITHDGNPIPGWELLGGEIQNAWEAGAQAAVSTSATATPPKYEGVPAPDFTLPYEVRLVPTGADIEPNQVQKVKPAQQVPSIGRIVHYIDHYGVVNAAIITRAVREDDRVDLAVFGNDMTKLLPCVDVVHDETYAARDSWHWPPFIAPK
jgi:hypothetical protein